MIFISTTELIDRLSAWFQEVIVHNDEPTPRYLAIQCIERLARGLYISPSRRNTASRSIGAAGKSVLEPPFQEDDALIQQPVSAEIVLNIPPGNGSRVEGCDAGRHHQRQVPARGEGDP